ncbi:putative peroxiredoxin bcp [Stieleria varia]|uniref:thioredoxin-dependent peroxiredoxin n=2 Tax=Stieleria varia TaxID=2528005 RepID=A0A5C6ALX9_9BACT|nr:putative peroxiredoxin bcp [Stieleria varia]
MIRLAFPASASLSPPWTAPMRYSIALTLFSLLALVLSAPAISADDAVSLSVGDEAPKFEAKDDSGETWKSTDHVGKKIIVLYFYPADMTGGCTAQACAYRDRMDELAAKDVMVVGVSGDTVENHKLFKKAHDLNFALLADTEGKVANAFGVPVSLGAKTVEKLILGKNESLTRNVTAKRWTFVIGLDGKIAYKDEKVNAKQDPEKIAEVIKDLK